MPMTMPMTPLIEELERLRSALKQVRDYLMVAILVATLAVCGLMLSLTSLFIGTGR